jgi:hypothetical protein
MNLQALLDSNTYQQISKDRQLVFHSVGDTEASRRQPTLMACRASWNAT